MLPSPNDTEERSAFREQVRRFVENEMKPFIAEWEEAGDFPESLRRKAGELGLYGFGIDEQYGGLGFDDVFMRCALFEEIAKCGGGGPGAIFACYIATGPIQKLASEAIKQKVLPAVMRGESGLCLGITEPSGGSDVANIRTTAVRDGDEYVLNGSKMFITGGIKSQYYLIAARTGDTGMGGVSLFLVEKGAPGFTQSELDKKMGWWSSDTAALYFENCRIPASNLVGEENAGFGPIMKNFNMERHVMISTVLGAARVCLDYAVDYARERETFGKPLIKHQVIRHKLSEMSSRIDAIQCLMDRNSWLIEQGRMPVAELAKTKFFATQQIEYIAREAMQILGGAGYLRGNPVERIYREVRVLAIGGGSEEIMRDLAARQMGW